VWTVRVAEDGQGKWIRNSDIHDSPIEDPNTVKKALKSKNISIQCASEFLFIGDLKAVHNFSKTHTLQETIDKFSIKGKKRELYNGMVI
jgi:hypothetical protein